MKFFILNLLIIALSIVHKVSSASVFDDSKECHLYYQWIGEDPKEYPECCDGSNPYMCNSNERVNSISVNAKYHNHPDFSTFPIFEQLTYLIIYDYGSDSMKFVEPFDLHANIFKQPSLKQLIVDSVFANDITTDIDPNCPLEELTLNNTEIKSLPNSLFKLNKLKKIELENNSLMNVKIVKFKNSPIECNIENTNIECYQEGACSNISSSDYKKCTEDEINEILGKEEIKASSPDNQSNTNTDSKNTKSDDKDTSSSGNKNTISGFLIKSIVGISTIFLYLF